MSDAGLTSTATRTRLITVDQYYAMGRAGAFGESKRVELLEGEIIHMSPIGSRHQAVVDRVTRLLVTRVGDRAIVRVQGPVRLASITEPQPDVQLLSPRDDFYAAAHPSQYEALLVVEVADTSLRYDRDRKAPIYARRGVHETWIVDLTGDRILVMRDPAIQGYRDVTTVSRGESLAPQALPDLTVGVEELLGPG